MLSCIYAGPQELPHIYLLYFPHLFEICQHDLVVSLPADNGISQQDFSCVLSSFSAVTPTSWVTRGHQAQYNNPQSLLTGTALTRSNNNNNNNNKRALVVWQYTKMSSSTVQRIKHGMH